MKNMLLALAIILMVNATTAGQPAPELKCTPQLIDQALLRNDLDSALTLTEHCLSMSRADLERQEKETRGQPPKFVDVVRLARSNTGTFLIAKVEILAMKDALSQAESALAEAEKLDQKDPGAGMSWSLTGAPLPTARAFLLEKKGNLDDAATAYQSILVDAKKDGWPVPQVVPGRLAIISLLKGDEATAEQWCSDFTMNDPGINVARGVLLERKGDTRGAKQSYAVALKLMSDAANRKNWSLPIYFAELKRAQDGLNK